MSGFWLTVFLQKGLAAIGRSIRDKLRESVNAADFVGFDATGTTDSTAAINAAIAALPIQGGRLFIFGTPKFNIVITKSGLALVGPGNGAGSQLWVPGTSCWQPWDVAKPIIQVGDDTKIVANTSIKAVTLFGGDPKTGVGGVLCSSGCYTHYEDDVLFTGFTTYNLRCQGGNFPSSNIHLNNVEMPNPAIGIDLAPATGTSYTSGIFLNNTHISLNAGAIGIRNDGVTAFAVSLFVDTPSGAIAYQAKKTSALFPFLYAADVMLDCTGTGIAIDNTYSVSLIMPDFIRGNVQVGSGLIRNNVAVTVAQYSNSAKSSYFPQLYNPMVNTRMTFPDFTVAGFGTDQSAQMFGSGAVGVRAFNASAVALNLIGTTASGVNLGSTNVTRWQVTDSTLRPQVDNSYSFGTAAQRASAVFAGYHNFSVAAPGAAAGTINIGGTTAATVGAAGGATALPATPLGYIIANVAGTQVKIPYFST